MLLLEVDDYAGLLSREGDAVSKVLLRTTTQFLKAAMRDMDMVARFSDEQFSVLLPGSDEERAVSVGERLRHAIERCKLPLGGEDLQFTVSVGATSVVEGDDADSFVERTQLATRKSRDAGGNCINQAELTADV